MKKEFDIEGKQTFVKLWKFSTRMVDTQKRHLYPTDSFYSFQDINFLFLMVNYFFIIRNPISILI